MRSHLKETVKKGTLWEYVEWVTETLHAVTRLLQESLSFDQTL